MVNRPINKSFSGTLSAGVVDTVQIAPECGTIQIFNRSQVDSIFVRLDGEDPAVEADGVKVVLPGQSRRVPEVRLISGGLSVPYTVESYP
jgi:hypothetical protein